MRPFGEPTLVRVLTTPRLLLRPFTMDDAPAIHAIYSDPEVMRHVGNGPVTSLAATEKMLRDYIAHQDRRGFSFWAVVHRESGALIGDAGLYGSDEVELGYTLGRAWWGRGYATEAARACLDAAFGAHGLDEVIALAEAANPASGRVLGKVGMTPSGTRIAYGREHLVYRASAQKT
jgi:ribosomal-protein-alanine N-acetyltransferase